MTKKRKQSKKISKKPVVIETKKDHSRFIITLCLILLIIIVSFTFGWKYGQINKICDLTVCEINQSQEKANYETGFARGTFYGGNERMSYIKSDCIERNITEWKCYNDSSDMCVIPMNNNGKKFCLMADISLVKESGVNYTVE